jgi:hypothetical protein
MQSTGVYLGVTIALKMAASSPPWQILRLPAAVGAYPQWLKDSPDVISAYVPHQDGSVRAGVY